MIQYKRTRAVQPHREITHQVRAAESLVSILQCRAFPIPLFVWCRTVQFNRRTPYLSVRACSCTRLPRWVGAFIHHLVTGQATLESFRQHWKASQNVSTSDPNGTLSYPRALIELSYCTPWQYAYHAAQTCSATNSVCISPNSMHGSMHTCTSDSYRQGGTNNNAVFVTFLNDGFSIFSIRPHLHLVGRDLTLPRQLRLPHWIILLRTSDSDLFGGNATGLAFWLARCV